MDTQDKIRLARHGEIANDHQIDIAKRFAQSGYLLAAYKKEDLLEKGAICYIGAVPNRIDIFNEQGPVDFEKAWEKRKDDKYWDVNVHFISREDLMILKRYADREQDRKDLKRLKRKK